MRDLQAMTAESVPPGRFDAIADVYDRDFTDTWLGRVLRERVHRALEDAFTEGDHVLDVGCGTGEDAVWMARRGLLVTGVDASAAMLAIAWDKVVTAGVGERATFAQVDISAGRTAFVASLFPPGGPHVVAPDPAGVRPEPGRFDGALANFGVVNCVEDRRALASALAVALRPGAALALVVMGPFCLWETAWRLAHGDLRGATRRWRRQPVARIGEGTSIPLWYPSPRRLRDEFTPWFSLRHLTAVGAMLPPTDVGQWTDRHPRAAGILDAADRKVEGRGLAAWASDHYLAVMKRR